MNIKYGAYDSLAQKQMLEKVVEKLDNNAINIAVLEKLGIKDLYSSLARSYLLFLDYCEKFNLYSMFINDAYYYEECDFSNYKFYIYIWYLESCIQIAFRLADENDFLLDLKFYKEIIPILCKYKCVNILKDSANSLFTKS